MPTITRKAKPGVDANSAARADQLAGNLYAGENLDASAACHIAADGKVYMSSGAQAGAAPTAAEKIAAHVDGFTPTDYRTGEPVTLIGPGLRVEYGSGLAPATDLYLSATKGRLDDAASTLGTKVIARITSATHIVVVAKA